MKQNQTCMKQPIHGAVIARLSSESGESLTETLVAVLIVALASVLLVTMVLAARRVITRSGKAYSSYISEHNALEEIASSSTSTDSTVTEQDKKEIVIAPAKNDTKASDYSLPQIKEYVNIRESKDGNLTFFPANQG
ncbi:MAG: hypothetical protein ACI4ET_00230 [Bilifractor sp.]